MNFDKMFKAITRSSGHTFWWERTVLHSVETFDTGLVALESISPGKGICYSTLRCCTLPSKENFTRQQPAPWFCDRFYSHPYSAALSFPPRGVTGTSCYHFVYAYQNSINLDRESSISVFQYGNLMISVFSDKM